MLKYFKHKTFFANHVEGNFIARWPKRSTTPLSTLSCFYFQVKLSSELNKYFSFQEKSQIVCLRCWGRNKLLVKSIVFPLESIFCHKDDKIGSLSCLGTFAKIYCQQKFISAASQRPLFNVQSVLLTDAQSVASESSLSPITNNRE